MIMNNIWSQGQLFAFSAWDGNSLFTQDFVGILCGDKTAIRFFTRVKRELSLTTTSRSAMCFEAVTGDYIKIQSPDCIELIYARRNLIIGSTTERTYPVIHIEGNGETYTLDDIQVTDTGDGDFTAFCLQENRFAFAYGSSPESAVALAKEGLTLNLQQEAKKKLSFYRAHSLADANPYARLYNKCLSTMKTQLYSPEGNLQHMWSTPDRLPHRHCWLWDSVFHSIGWRNISPTLAQDLILAIFDAQDASGFIPHMFSVNYLSNITQPPVIAWGAWLVYEKSGDKAFLKTVWEQNKRFLLWCQKNRRITSRELYTWNTEDDPNCRCGESGMDNSPRFDAQKRQLAIDFSCFMANETRYMEKIARELKINDAEFFRQWHETICSDINEVLWCEEQGFYFDYIPEDQCFHKVSSVASFLPLFSGVCSRDQAKKLFAELINPETFYTPFPIPSISKQDATFGSDMWRGPVWINYNYMISIGLEDYGYGNLAQEIREKTVYFLNYWYNKKGTIFEFYDSENTAAPNELNRKGPPLEPYNFEVRYQSIRDYGWSNTLLLDLLHNHFQS